VTENSCCDFNISQSWHQDCYNYWQRNIEIHFCVRWQPVQEWDWFEMPSAVPLSDIGKAMNKCYMKLFCRLLNARLLYSSNIGIWLISYHSEFIWLKNCLWSALMLWNAESARPAFFRHYSAQRLCAFVGSKEEEGRCVLVWCIWCWCLHEMFWDCHTQSDFKAIKYYILA
jgi:hypothetical protein